MKNKQSFKALSFIKNNYTIWNKNFLIKQFEKTKFSRVNIRGHFACNNLRQKNGLSHMRYNLI